MNEDEFKELREALIKQLAFYMLMAAADHRGALFEIQPTTSVIGEACEAAAAAFISFERGYQMTQADESRGSNEHYNKKRT